MIKFRFFRTIICRSELKAKQYNFVYMTILYIKQFSILENEHKAFLMVIGMHYITNFNIFIKYNG